MSPGRRRIFDAAVSVFADRGYSSANVREVAKLAGIAPSTIYHHFTSKDRLYEHVLRIASAELRGAVTQSLEALGPEGARPERALEAFIEAIAAFARANPRLHRFVFAMHAGVGPPGAARILVEEVDRVRGMIREIFERTLPPAEAEVAETAFSAQLAGWIQLAFHDPSLLGRPEIRARILGIHAIGLDRTAVR